jgi:hypothetical protein
MLEIEGAEKPAKSHMTSGLVVSTPQPRQIDPWPLTLSLRDVLNIDTVSPLESTSSTTSSKTSFIML